MGKPEGGRNGSFDHEPKSVLIFLLSPETRKKLWSQNFRWLEEIFVEPASISVRHERGQSDASELKLSKQLSLWPAAMSVAAATISCKLSRR